MNNNIPEAIQRISSAPIDWVEQDDLLHQGEQSFSYHERNQQDWWRQNRDIRVLFINIEREIKSLISSKKIPSVLLVSWSQLSRKLSCDRATLRHPRRFYWVNAKRTKILEIITEAKKQVYTIEQPLYSKDCEIKQLKDSLHCQRTETAQWYARCLELEGKIELLNRTLSRREEQLRTLSTNKRPTPNTFESGEDGIEV